MSDTIAREAVRLLKLPVQDKKHTQIKNDAVFRRMVTDMLATEDLKRIALDAFLPFPLVPEQTVQVLVAFLSHSNYPTALRFCGTLCDGNPDLQALYKTDLHTIQWDGQSDETVAFVLLALRCLYPFHRAFPKATSARERDSALRTEFRRVKVLANTYAPVIFSDGEQLVSPFMMEWTVQICLLLRRLKYLKPDTTDPEYATWNKTVSRWNRKLLRRVEDDEEADFIRIAPDDATLVDECIERDMMGHLTFNITVNGKTSQRKRLVILCIGRAIHLKRFDVYLALLAEVAAMNVSWQYIACHVIDRFIRDEIEQDLTDSVDGGNGQADESEDDDDDDEEEEEHVETALYGTYVKALFSVVCDSMRRRNYHYGYMMLLDDLKKDAHVELVAKYATAMLDKVLVHPFGQPPLPHLSDEMLLTRLRF